MVTDSRSVSEHVVRSVAEAIDADPAELPVLYEAIDPDALDAAVRTMSSGTVSFPYAGHSVTVRNDGTVSVTAESASESEQAISATDD